MTTPPNKRTWDLTDYFPTFDGPEYRAFIAALSEELAQTLENATNLRAIGSGSQGGTEWALFFLIWEDLSARVVHLQSYLSNLGAADSSDERFRTHEDAVSLHSAALTKVKTQLLRVLGPATEEQCEALLALSSLRDATYIVQKWRLETRHQMSAPEEALAADLGVDGYVAWSRLYDATVGPLSFEMTFPDGEKKTIPFSQRRALMEGADRAVRKEAFERGNAVVKPAATTYAAAINAMAGTRLTLNTRRKRAHYLDLSLHEAGLSRESVEAMFSGVKSHYDLSRRLLRIGAKLQGTKALAWYDLEAPRTTEVVPTSSWEEGTTAVQSAFDASYPALGDYFRSMIDKRWIESEKRPNKRPGAYCTGSPVIRQERIYMTFSGSMGDVFTLAHEAGHAWHSYLLNDLRPVARDYPMTLAETASTFAEKLLLHGLLQAPDLTPSKRRLLLTMESSNTPSYLLNIPARFLFESKFYEERQKGTVPVARLCEIMTEAQREVYGDTLETGLEDPWFWATKMHFYIHEVSFYNYPYTFGFLLSQALFTEFKTHGQAFLPRYEDFLRATGRANCEEAVKSTLGWDIREPAFWSKAILGFEPAVVALEREFGA